MLTTPGIEMQCHGGEGFYVCFLVGPGQVAAVSLNRSEHLLFAYALRHPDERHYLESKVQKIASHAADAASAVSALDGELWRYFDERSRVVPAFVEARRTYGPARVSMKNLAEHLIRLWTEPRPRSPAPPEEPAGDLPH